MGNAIITFFMPIDPAPHVTRKVVQNTRPSFHFLGEGLGMKLTSPTLFQEDTWIIPTAIDCYTMRFSPTSVGWYIQWAHCLSVGLSDQTNTLLEAGSFCNGLVNSLCLKQIMTCLKWKVFWHFRVSHSWGERWQYVDSCCTQWQSSRISWTH